MNNEEIIYQLTVEDIQTVANDELSRDLSFAEIKNIQDLIGEKINWYDVIADSISERIDLKDVVE